MSSERCRGWSHVDVRSLRDMSNNEKRCDCNSLRGRLDWLWLPLRFQTVTEVSCMRADFTRVALEGKGGYANGLVLEAVV